jgi:enoyl-[acyl-carrier protein] reductase I
MLSGKKGVIFGIRSPRTIGWSIAEAAHQHGATLCVSYRGEREQQRAEQLSQELGALALPCDVTNDEDVQTLYGKLGQEWGTVDFIVHSVAFAALEDLQAGMVGTSRDGFSLMNEISAYSLVAVTRPALPLMPNGGSIIALTYNAAQRVVPMYAPMSAAKASLECIVRYLASELGPSKIRCNAVSAGPVNTPASRGIPGFTELIRKFPEHAPLRRNVELAEVANGAVFLLSDMASAVTGQTLFVDCGAHIM